MSHSNPRLSFASIAENFDQILEANLIPIENIQKPAIPSFSCPSHIQDESLKTVFPALKELHEAVDGLNSDIGKIVKKQKEGYLSVYLREIVNVQKELKEMRKKYEDFMASRNQDDKIMSLQKQINQQKEEAIKQDKIITDKEKCIQALREKVSTLEDERKFLNKYITEVVKKNKLISIERHTKPSRESSSVCRAPPGRGTSDNKLPLHKARALYTMTDDDTAIFNLSKIPSETCPQDLNHIEFETGISQLDEFLNKLKSRDFSDKFRVLKDIETFGKSLAFTYERKCLESKKKIMKEKVKGDSLANLKLIARAELAEIFEDCVKRVKLDIEKRKREGLKNMKDGNGALDRRSMEIIPPVKVEYKDFLSKDKVKLLELFVCDETVLGVIKYLISGGKEFTNKPSPREKAYRRHNQSVGDVESMMSMMQSSETLLEPKPSKEIAKNPSTIRRLHSMSISSNLPKVMESQKDLSTLESLKDESRQTSQKLEQLRGMTQGSRLLGPQSGVAKDATKNYKM